MKGQYDSLSDILIFRKIATLDNVSVLLYRHVCTVFWVNNMEKLSEGI